MLGGEDFIPYKTLSYASESDLAVCAGSVPISIASYSAENIPVFSPSGYIITTAAGGAPLIPKVHVDGMSIENPRMLWVNFL